MLRPTKKKPTAPPPDMTQTECERLLVHGLPVAHVTDTTITWASPPTEAHRQFAAELLGRKVSHSHA